MLIPNPTGRIDDRIRILRVTVILVMALLIFRLHRIQVQEGAKHMEQLEQQTTVAIRLPAARGRIVDCNGVGIAENKASIDLDINLRELVSHYARDHKGNIPRAELPGRGSVVDAHKIVKAMTADLIESLGRKNDLAQRRKALLKHYDQKPHLPYQLLYDLDFETLSKFSENSKLRVPGLSENANPIRVYNYGAFASHILGYVGMPEEIIDWKNTPREVGKDGLEKTFEEYLQGVQGSELLRKDNRGYIIKREARVQPRVGNTIELTIDARIQNLTEQALRRAQVGRGACVVMNPWSGDILAMASVPNFDPNVFVSSIDEKDWRRLLTDQTKPLLNRALGVFPPGSTFKIMIALAALSNPHVNFTPKTYINCPQAIAFGNHVWHDWYQGARGPIQLHTGIEWSCNTFFYQLAVYGDDGARAAGKPPMIDSIVKIAKLIGVGEPLLVDDQGMPMLAGEDPGFMPSPQQMNGESQAKIDQWKKDRGEWSKAYKKDKTLISPAYPSTEWWSKGHTYNIAIGQGKVETSPMHICSLAATVANGGKVYQPRLVKRIVTATAEGEQPEEVKKFSIIERGKIPISPENIRAIQDGMRAVVATGTAKKAKVDGFTVAGKTGTAQFKRNGQDDFKVWFMAFAPYEQPRYAICVMIEGGKSGGGDAAPIVREIFTGIRDLELGFSPELVYLNPAHGHFRGPGSIHALTSTTVARATPVIEPNPDVVPASTQFQIPEEESDEGRVQGAQERIRRYMRSRRNR